MKYSLLVLALISLQVHAGKITMVNPQEEQTENGKTLCIYENSNYTFTYLTKGKCLYARTFDTDD